MGFLIFGGEKMNIPTDRILRKPETQYRVGLSDPTIYRLEKSGRFPKRIQLGGNSVGWFESEVNAWLEEKRAER
jgi:prophage regulatory protein